MVCVCGAKSNVCSHKVGETKAQLTLSMMRLDERSVPGAKSEVVSLFVHSGRPDNATSI